MSFYDEMAATAAEMIAEFGQPVTISITEPGAYDTDTGKSGSGATTTVSALGVMTAYKAGEVDGTLIRHGDRRLAVSPTDAAGNPLPQPPTGSRVVLADGSKWQAVVVEAINPAGTALVYRLQLRA